MRDYQIDDAVRQKCKIHYGDGCDGPIITRRSIFGAVQRACEKAWTVPFLVGQYHSEEEGKLITIDLNGWPEILNTEAW